MVDAHGGVNEADPRNRGVIERFRPREVTAERARARLTPIMRHKTPAEIEARVAQLMTDLASKEVAAPPPLSQALADAKDPVFGLGTHPDIVSRLWRLDRALPQSCRWVVWGYPALVHPRSGVIFAVAYGTVGVAARLPPHLRDDSPAVLRNPFGEDNDITAAGPEWRFLSGGRDESGWRDETECRAAHDFAAQDPLEGSSA